MDKKFLKKLPNGKWEYLVDEKNEMIVVADTMEEAQRMAEAYFKGDKSLAKKRVARQTGNRAGSALIGGN